ASYDLDNIVSVLATTHSDGLADFSNYGATTVDLGAPGGSIFSCWNGSDSDYRSVDGSSMAAAHVSGVCALLLAHYPSENYQQIIRRILSTVDPLPSLAGKCVTGGRLNLQKALAGSAPPPPEKPTVTVSATDAQAAEQGPDRGTFTISRAGDTSSDLSVNYTLGGTAQNGRDYEQLGNSVTIAAGASSTTVTVRPIDDGEIEGDESVTLTISESAAYNVGSLSNATLTIADNDGPPPPPEKPMVTVVATDAQAAERGPDGGIFTIRRTGGTASDLTVYYSVSGLAANGTDYEQLSGTATLAVGEPSTTVVVRPLDDSEVEGDETVALALSSDSAYQIGSPDTATVTIHDNDQAPPPEKPTVSVVASDLLASEPGTDTGSFTFSRTGSGAASLTVHYSLGGTAINGVDYETLSGSVTIPDGASSVTVVVRPIDDRKIEIAELVILTLIPDEAYTIGLLSTATVTILDNDLL